MWCDVNCRPSMNHVPCQASESCRGVCWNIYQGKSIKSSWLYYVQWKFGEKKPVAGMTEPHLAPSAGDWTFTLEIWTKNIHPGKYLPLKQKTFKRGNLFWRMYFLSMPLDRVTWNWEPLRSLWSLGSQPRPNSQHCPSPPKMLNNGIFVVLNIIFSVRWMKRMQILTLGG